MAHLLSIPENVMIQQLFPYLDHNDVLRLRRVSKQTKALADAYLWTPQPAHQGKWELEINYHKKDKGLQAFLQLRLPPPPRLLIVNLPSERGSFFEDEHLAEFMERYGKYVTKLTLFYLYIPFTSSKELGFYECLVNLKELHCVHLITVGGAAQFEEKTRNPEGGFLIRPTFKKLKIFRLSYTDCEDSMWNFINGVSNNLEELSHPFHCGNRFVVGEPLAQDNIEPVKQLIERRGMNNQSKLVYDWSFLFQDIDPLELLRVFASCRDNGVMIQNLNARFLRCLLCDEKGRIADRDEVVDPISHEWISSSDVNYERNLFVGSVIHSLEGVTDNVFLMEMPALEKIEISWESKFQIYPRRGVGNPQWPNLRKMRVWLDQCSPANIRFLLEEVKRPKLDELVLCFGRNWEALCPRDLGNCCGNLKKLTIDCYPGNDNLFLALWEEFPLLEDVTLYNCWMLTNEGFVGTPVAGSEPAFLKLKKLKHLAIQNISEMPMITNEVFKKVFRHLKLSSFTLTSYEAIESISVAGIEELLTGSFAETIERLNLGQLKLKKGSEEELKQVVSRFRCSKMV